MANRKSSTNPSTSEPVFLIAHLFRDPVLQRAFGAAEDGLDGAPALPAPNPPPKTDPLTAEVDRLCGLFETAMTAERIRKANRTPAEVTAEETHQKRVAETVRRVMESRSRAD